MENRDVVDPKKTVTAVAPRIASASRVLEHEIESVSDDQHGFKRGSLPVQSRNPEPSAGF